MWPGRGHPPVDKTRVRYVNQILKAGISRVDSHRCFNRSRRNRRRLYNIFLFVAPQTRMQYSLLRLLDMIFILLRDISVIDDVVISFSAICFVAVLLRLYYCYILLVDLDFPRVFNFLWTLNAMMMGCHFLIYLPT